MSAYTQVYVRYIKAWGISFFLLTFFVFFVLGRVLAHSHDLRNDFEDYFAEALGASVFGTLIFGSLLAAANIFLLHLIRNRRWSDTKVRVWVVVLNFVLATLVFPFNWVILTENTAGAVPSLQNLLHFLILFLPFMGATLISGIVLARGVGKW